MTNEFEQQAQIAAEAIKKIEEARIQASKNEAENLLSQATGNVKASNEDLKAFSIKLAAVDIKRVTTDVVEKQKALIGNLSQAFESKKLELEALAAKDAESVRALAKSYITSTMNALESQIVIEKMRLDSIENKIEKEMSVFAIFLNNLKSFFTKVL